MLCFILLMRAFAKTVLFGALAGAAPGLLWLGVLAVLLPFEDSGGGWISFPVSESLVIILYMALLLLAASFLLVLVASICIGIPFTKFLQHKGWESGIAYISAGGFVGFFLPIVVERIMRVYDPTGIAAFLGVIGGMVTGRSWWVYGRRPLLTADEAGV